MTEKTQIFFLRSMRKVTILSLLDTTLKKVMLVKIVQLTQGTREK